MDKNRIVGVSHPVPTEIAERIYNQNKNVFVSKKQLGKVSVGDKFIIYESHGAKAYTGMGDIEFIGKLKPNQIIQKYKSKLMITSEELKEYSKHNDSMNVIEFKNFEKFANPVTPKRYVSVGGKYIYEDEYEYITRNKG